jgi:hypothetical protein
MPVNVVLVNPVEDDDCDQEEKGDVRDVEDVVRVEVPNSERDHQLEVDWEGRRSDLLMQALLAVDIGL